MRNRSPFSLLRLISLALVFIALIIMILQLITFSRIWANYPAGLMIAGVPVGLLDRQQSAQRLLEVYTQPVELYYRNSVIQLAPSSVSFELDLESMLAAAEIERTRLPFWEGFWNYLWGRTANPANIPLRSNYSEDRLREFLVNEISTRYDQPSTPARPIPGSVEFQSGTSGTTLNVDRSISLIEDALVSNTNRIVDLPLQNLGPATPTISNLDVMLKQTVVDLNNYDGSIGVYLLDLETGHEISFYYEQNELLSIPPDIPFTASSTIKIPIMVSAFRRINYDSLVLAPEDQEVMDNLKDLQDRFIRDSFHCL